MPSTIINQDQWVNDFKEGIAKTFCLGVIGISCFGAAASSFLAIPGLLKLLDLQLSNTIVNVFYCIAVVNGVTYSISQFWDGLLESTRVNIFKLPPAHKQEINEKNLSVKENIKKIRLEIIRKVETLEQNGINISEHNDLKITLNQISHLITFDNHINQKLNEANHENKESTINSDPSLFDTIKYLLFYSNSLFASMVISTGILTSVILTILGTSSAIETLAPLLLSPAAVSGLPVTVMACFVAFCTQYCKSSTFGQKQWNLLMINWFGDDNKSDNNNLSPMDTYLKLQVALSQINEISLENQRKEMRTFPSGMVAATP